MRECETRREEFTVEWKMGKRNSGLEQWAEFGKLGQDRGVVVTESSADG